MNCFIGLIFTQFFDQEDLIPSPVLSHKSTFGHFVRDFYQLVLVENDVIAKKIHGFIF